MSCVTKRNGLKCWYDYNGKLHRDDDLPAVIHPEGSKEWYKHGRHHRVDDKPAVIFFAR